MNEDVTNDGIALHVRSYFHALAHSSCDAGDTFVTARALRECHRELEHGPHRSAGI